MSKPSDFMRVCSNDGYEFFLERAVVPKNFPEQLPYPMRVVEKVLQYLHYRHQNVGRDLSTLPQFDLDPSIALDVLRASIDLKI